MKKKLRILYTIPNFNTAGSGKVLYDLAKGLDSNEFEVSIACKNNKGTFFKEIEALGFPIYFLDPTVPIRPYYSLLSRICHFRKFVKDQNIDIVHSWHWSSDWTEVIGSRWGGAKFVFTKKAMTWGNIHWKIRSFLSSFIVTVNEEMRSYFAYKQNQKLIPFGIDIEYFNPNKFSKPTKNEILKIITVANLIQVKNIEIIIDAIQILNNTKIHLDIIGDDQTEYGTLLKRKVIDKKLDHQVFFLGKQKDVRPFLAKSDLYIISSKKEGMPMALVEAMTMEVPVFGTNISGINFVLKEFQNLLFETTNEQLLSKKIAEFSKKTKEERIANGKELREYCIKHFSLKKCIQEHEILYKKLND